MNALFIFGGVMRSIWRFFSSLEVCVVLLMAVCCSMAVGSFLLKGETASAINSMPLLTWMYAVPLSVAWWLWLVLILLLLLAINTVVCSTDLLAIRWGRINPVTLLAPQLMHAGFLLIMLAHGISAYGSYFEQLQVLEGSVAQLPGGHRFGIASLNSVTTPQGMPIGFSAEIAPDLQNVSRRMSISPNHPWFADGYGVYLKHVEMYPYRQGLLEIHREPGGGAALAGAILFTVGNVLVVWQRSRAREAV